MLKNYTKMMIDRKNVILLIEKLARAFNDTNDDIITINAEREKALFVLIEEHQGEYTKEQTNDTLKATRELPSITPQEPKTGYWISRWYAGHDFRFHICSECNEEFSCDMETGISIDNYRYCPNCGAKMEEVAE